MPSGSQDSADARRMGVTRLAGLLWVVGVAQYVVAMAVAQLGWTTPYSLLGNYISDLGAVRCDIAPATGVGLVCSPWHAVFDVSVALLGALVVAGAVLSGRAWPPRALAQIGRALACVAGVAAIAIGLFPEDVNPVAHGLSSLLAFVAGNAGTLVLGFAVWRRPAWRDVRALGIGGGILGLASLVWFVSGAWGPVGPGGTERLVVAPMLLWAAVAGARIYRTVASTRPAPAEIPARTSRGAEAPGTGVAAPPR